MSSASASWHPKSKLPRNYDAPDCLAGKVGLKHMGLKLGLAHALSASPMSCSSARGDALRKLAPLPLGLDFHTASEKVGVDWTHLKGADSHGTRRKNAVEQRLLCPAFNKSEAS